MGVVTFTFRHLYRRKKRPCCPMNRRLSGPHSRSELFEQSVCGSCIIDRRIRREVWRVEGGDLRHLRLSIGTRTRNDRYVCATWPLDRTCTRRKVAPSHHVSTASPRPLAAEALVQSLSSSRGISGGQIGSEILISLNACFDWHILKMILI